MPGTALNNLSVETKSQLYNDHNNDWYNSSDRMIIFFCTKTFFKSFCTWLGDRSFQWHVMTQMDKNIESTNRTNDMTSWHIWKTSMSHVPTMLKSDRSVCVSHATYWTIMKSVDPDLRLHYFQKWYKILLMFCASGLIWIQTAWDSDGIPYFSLFPIFTFWKKRQTKNHYCKI